MSDYITENIYETLVTLIEANITIGGVAVVVNPRGFWYNIKKKGTQIIVNQVETRIELLSCDHTIWRQIVHFDIHVISESFDNAQTTYLEIRKLLMRKSKCIPPDVTGTKIQAFICLGSFAALAEGSPQPVTMQERDKRGEYNDIVLMVEALGREETDA